MITWIVFIIAVSFFILLDLLVFNKGPEVIDNKKAAKWTTLWVTLALLFTGGIYLIYQNGWINNPESLTPQKAAIMYVTGYLIELSLSVDNIFVIAAIFASFSIPQKYQHRVLFWGIMGAIVFRLLTIMFGVALINRFFWTTYVFGAFLIYTGIHMVYEDGEEDFNPQTSFVYRMFRRFIPITTEIKSEAFFVKKKYLTAATPLFMTLVLIEFTDILFALDSIPAILAITTDPFIVFSSNVMAILGLRSMFFFLSNMMAKFAYIKYSLAVILSYVGVKLMLSHHLHIPEYVSLSIILVSLTAGILYSKYKD